jgi:hypothetical protein
MLTVADILNSTDPVQRSAATGIERRGPRGYARELIAANFATVFKFLAVLFFTAGIRSFDWPIPAG